MDTINYTYIPPSSEILNMVAGLTYQCPECHTINLIESKDEVWGTLVQRVPDKQLLDLIFAHECEYCRIEVTVSQHLPHAFRVWQRVDDTN